MEIYLTRIKNWFDHKWLGYSGRAVVGPPEDAWIGLDGCLRPTWSEALTFPPFNPARILRQRYICWTTKSFYQEQPVIDLVHSHRSAHSASNLRRFTQEHAPSAAFFWYSSNTAANGQGSLLVHEAKDGHASGWYASFQRRDGWKLAQTKGCDRSRLERWFAPQPD